MEISSEIDTYRIIVAAAFGTGFFLALFRLRRAGFPPTPTIEVLGTGVWTALGGGIALHWLIAQVYTLILPDSSHPITGGVTVIGGLICSTAAMILVCRWRNLDSLRFLDVVSVTVPLAQAIGRLGCLSASCCYGKVSDSWLAVKLPDLDGVTAPRYPTQMLSSAANLLIFSTLLLLERHFRRDGGIKPYPGFFFHIFLLLYCLKRSAIELLRDTAPTIIGPLTWAHFVTLPGLAITTYLLVKGLRSSRIT